MTSEQDNSAILNSGGFKVYQDLGLLTLPEVMILLRIKSYSTLHRLVKSGEIPATKVGGKWKVYPDDLSHYISHQSNRTRAVAYRDKVSKSVHLVKAIGERSAILAELDTKVADKRTELTKLNKLYKKMLKLHHEQGDTIDY
jgi:excisionase family DNA binding protein